VLTVSVITNPEALIFSEPAAIFVGPPPMQCICASPVLYNPGGMVRGVSLVQLGVPSDLERAEKAPLQDMHVTLPPLSAAAFAASMGRPCDMPAPVLRGAMRCADVDIPTWEGACIYLLAPFMAPSSEHEQVMLINWAGPPGTFPVYRLRDVLNPGTTEDVLAQWFRNRVVIIGSMVERVNTPRLGRGRSDPRYVDQSGAVTLCGPEVHANALNTIMQRRFIQPPSWPLMWALILGCSLLVAAAVRLTHGWVATATVASAMAVLIVVSALLVWADIWVYVVTPGVAMGLSILGATVWNYARARQEAAALEREASAREEATATIVHDLKQPLAAIGGLATIIEMSQSKTPEDDKSRELLGRIQRQVQRGLSDLDEILVANPDRQLHLQPERFDLVALARDLAADQSGKSTVHEVEVRGPEAGVWIDGDPRYLARALSNLMDNAIRYWPEGGTVLVEVRAFGNEALLSVTDQGMGLPREQVPLIFERYHRAVPEGVNIPGTGLGLYSVRRIVEAHGGSVEVWSELGKGSIFTLHLPLTQPDPRVPPGGRRQ